MTNTQYTLIHIRYVRCCFSKSLVHLYTPTAYKPKYKQSFIKLFKVSLSWWAPFFFTFAIPAYFLDLIFQQCPKTQKKLNFFYRRITFGKMFNYFLYNYPNKISNLPELLWFKTFSFPKEEIFLNVLFYFIFVEERGIGMYDMYSIHNDNENNNNYNNNNNNLFRFGVWAATQLRKSYVNLKRKIKRQRKEKKLNLHWQTESSQSIVLPFFVLGWLDCQIMLIAVWSGKPFKLLFFLH